MAITSKVKKVYSYISGRKVKFGYRWVKGASVAGEWRWREYDEQWDWTYIPTPGLSYQPSDSWLYRHRPDEVIGG